MDYEVEDMISDIKSLCVQYMNDLKYPPKDDSKDRRVQWINSILAKVEHPAMEYLQVVAKIKAEIGKVIAEIEVDRDANVDDEDVVKMYNGDIEYGIYCLDSFVLQTSNLSIGTEKPDYEDLAFIKKLLLDQDTAARERYENVFDMIEEASLTWHNHTV